MSYALMILVLNVQMGFTNLLQLDVLLKPALQAVLLIIGAVGECVFLALKELQGQKLHLDLLQPGMLIVPQQLDQFYQFHLLVFLLFYR
jgi:hypothetical protein